MGLIRDAIGTALGSDQVANGFNGPKLPFGNKGSSIRDMRRSALSSPSRQGYISEISYQNDRGLYPPEDMQRGMARQQGYNGYQNRGPPLPPRCEPPPYASDNQSWYQEEPYNGQRFDEQPYNGQRFDEQSYYQQGPVRDMGYPRDMGYSSRDAGFRPIALPQISYGDGQPFLRGYSNELSRYGISEAEFIRLVDAINVAIIPSPENQIFQKGANIAGWFVPGAAGIGLAVGQIGVGIGAAVGHASVVNRNLSKANLDMFLPNGLEICIGKTKDLEAELGLNPASSQSQSLFGATPGQRCAQYGDMIAPLSQVLSPLEQSGRNDPIAKLGRGLASRGDQKKVQKAEKDMAKKGGKNKKLDSLEGGLKWLIIRKASANAVAHWEQTLDQSNAAIQQENRMAEQSRYGRRN